MNRDGARLGALYAAIFASASVMSAYLPLFLADRGFGPARIGDVLGLGAAVRVIGVPVCGWASDRVGHRRMLAAAALITSACMAWLPQTSDRMLALLAVAAGVSASVLPAITDALTLSLAGEGRLAYGPTRAWGSIAFMAAAAAGGVALGRLGSGAVPWALAGGYGLAMVASLLVPDPPSARAGPTLAIERLGPEFRRALLATMLIQGSHAAYYGFASLHWRQAGLSDATIGLLIGEGILAEIALFIWAPRLAERLGPARLTGFAAICCVVRWGVLSATVALPALLAVQLLHAGTFACQHLSTMQVLRRVPRRRAGLAQTVMTAFGFAAPTGALTWVSGQLYGGGGTAMFLLMAVLGGLALPVASLLPRARSRAPAAL